MIVFVVWLECMSTRSEGRISRKRVLIEEFVV